MGDLITNIKSTRTKLPPFFSNLLPEGHMRDYLATQANIDSQRDFYLLEALGQDLPGAIRANRTDIGHPFYNKEEKDKIEREVEESILCFSLAGIQLKFSAIMEKEGGLTIPAKGVGGSWIV